MSGKLIGLILGGVAVIAVIVVLAATSGEETPSPTTAAAPSSTTAQQNTTEGQSSVTAQARTAPPAVACTSSQEPHIVASGLVTAIDGVPIAPPGQYEGIWFSHGNAVSITVPEAGGPAYVSVAALIATDQGQFQTYSVGHDSRGAYPPPDVRTPENYLAFDATGSVLAGSVGVAIDALEAGDVAATTPSVFTSSGFDAAFTGAAFTGTITHPDLDIVFVADSIERRDLPVFSSPECFQQAVESARQSDNPSP